MFRERLVVQGERFITEREGALYSIRARAVEIQNKGARKSVTSIGLGERQCMGVFIK